MLVYQRVLILWCGLNSTIYKGAYLGELGILAHPMHTQGGFQSVFGTAHVDYNWKEIGLNQTIRLQYIDPAADWST